MWDKRREKIFKHISWKSLKTRIFLIIVLAGIIPCILLENGILNNYEDRAVSVKISDVQTQMKIIADHLLNYNYL